MEFFAQAFDDIATHLEVETENKEDVLGAVWKVVDRVEAWDRIKSLRQLKRKTSLGECLEMKQRGTKLFQQKHYDAALLVI